ncbi:MAG: hypothetical protein IKM00_07910 [Clostridia bacterium]|nr:hypothetical protein [Clostridia bacterium]
MNLHKRQLFMQSIGNINLSGVRTLTKNLFIGTFLFETVGAILLAFRFCPMMGFWEGLFRASIPYRRFAKKMIDLGNEVMIVDK